MSDRGHGFANRVLLVWQWLNQQESDKHSPSDANMERLIALSCAGISNTVLGKYRRQEEKDLKTVSEHVCLCVCMHHTRTTEQGWDSES